MKDIKDNSGLFKNKQVEEEKEDAKNDVLAQKKLDVQEGVLVFLDSSDTIRVEMQPLKNCRKLNWSEALVMLDQAANFIRMQICLNAMGEHLENRIAQILGVNAELPKVAPVAGDSEEPH